MELFIRLYKDNDEIACEQFDGRTFFNAIPVYLANKLGIEKYPDECFAASLEAFEKRLNLKASKSVIEKLTKSSLLDEDDKYLLMLATNESDLYIESAPQRFIGAVKYKDYGNCEDIRSFLEDNEDILDSVTKICIERR